MSAQSREEPKFIYNKLEEAVKMEYTTVKLDEHDDFSEITLIQPSIDKVMISELRDIIEYLYDESSSKILIFKGDNKVFCQGLKVKVNDDIDLAEINRWEKLVKFIHNINKMTIAAIDGICFGAGIQLALSCDLRIATSKSVFSHNEVISGFLPGSTIMQLGKYCGIGRTLELLQTGEVYSADKAKSMGIINVCTDNLEDELKCRVNQYKTQNPKLYSLTRRLVWESYEMPENDFLGCCLAAQHQALLMSKETNNL
ncbi:MAG: enoyl-CoA hydratase/isomerase family protein [Gammaproteobacteria bacterium]|nr:enoyl-CoA hydratase/isomerase family protein [Gammaproteobacteria bacterium]